MKASKKIKRIRKLENIRKHRERLKESDDRLLYFAYGANMNLEGMRFRCPAAIPLFPFTMPNWKLVFRGVADIVEAEGESVPGAMWSITPECEKALNRFEGFPRLYVRKHFLLRGKNGKKRLGMFYVMREKSTILAPSTYYFDTIREGYRSFRQDESVLFQAAQEAPVPTYTWDDWAAYWCDKCDDEAKACSCQMLPADGA